MFDTEPINNNFSPDNGQLAYFPLNVNVAGKTIIVCGGGEDSVAKVRLLLKTRAEIAVYDHKFSPDLVKWSAEGRVHLIDGFPSAEAVRKSVFGYIGYEDEGRQIQAKALFDAEHTLVCVIDNISASSFITPAIIDRAPVTITIGSEGQAPVLVRQIKAMIERQLPAYTGRLAQLAGRLRSGTSRLGKGAQRRKFWTEIFQKIGPDILTSRPKEQQLPELIKQSKHLIDRLVSGASGDHRSARASHIVQFVSAGPGDAGLLTRDAEQALHDADVILHDRLVAPNVLEICRREARFIDVGKTGFSRSFKQEAINELLVSEAIKGGNIVRLKGGDAGLFGRLDEEIEALDKHNIGFKVIPGVTTACAMAAEMGVSLTRRGRNRQISFVTGYQLGGYCDHDWRQLAKKDAITAVYMGRRAVNFIQGRLLMFGAASAMPVTVAKTIASADVKWITTTLGDIAASLERQSSDFDQGPVLVLLGLTAHPSSLAAQMARRSAVEQASLVKRASLVKGVSL